METGFWAGENWERRRDRDRGARVSRRLQREPEYEISASRELSRVRCSRAGEIQNGRRHADREKDFGCKRRTHSRAWNVETCQSDRLVRERIRDRASLDESDE